MKAERWVSSGRAVNWAAVAAEAEAEAEAAEAAVVAVAVVMAEAGERPFHPVIGRAVE